MPPIPGTGFAAVLSEVRSALDRLAVEYEAEIVAVRRETPTQIVVQLQTQREANADSDATAKAKPAAETAEVDVRPRSWLSLGTLPGLDSPTRLMQVRDARCPVISSAQGSQDPEHPSTLGGPASSLLQTARCPGDDPAAREDALLAAGVGQDAYTESAVLLDHHVLLERLGYPVAGQAAGDGKVAGDGGVVGDAFSDPRNADGRQEEPAEEQSEEAKLIESPRAAISPHWIPLGPRQQQTRPSSDGPRSTPRGSPPGGAAVASSPVSAEEIAAGAVSPSLAAAFFFQAAPFIPSRVQKARTFDPQHRSKIDL